MIIIDPARQHESTRRACAARIVSDETILLREGLLGVARVEVDGIQREMTFL